MRKILTEEFIKKAKSIHGDKYSYDKVIYKNMRTEVCIVCPVHGEFWQKPFLHIIQRCGCPKCNGTKKKSLDEFIEKARIIHRDKYLYSKSVYKSTKDKICIICPEHGEFWQTPYEHLKGHGCPKCGGRSKLTVEEFVNKSKTIHGNKYDYSKSEYINNRTKVCIICPVHGEFWQEPSEHMRGHGCPLCGIIDNAENKSKPFSSYLDAFKKVHGDKYDYTNTVYIDSLTKINIRCLKHGVFYQLPYDHMVGHGCPKCASVTSNGEEEIETFIREELFLDTQIRKRDIIPPYELDIYIPVKKIAIEYDGLIWHSEKFNKAKNYHLNKTIECEKQGIRLIHIFENEWLEHKDIVKSKLRHILKRDNGTIPKVFARKCLIKDISKQEAHVFLDKNHIQGKSNSSVYMGCFYNEELIGVMTFKKESKTSNKWELTRFATDINKQCVGVGGKLFKYFVRKYKPIEIKSFADRRWCVTENSIYDKLGFKLDSILKPDYYYTNGNVKLIHKFNFRKQILHKKYGLPLTMTENEMTEQIGYYKIWNCGLFKYIWKNIVE